MQIIPVLDLKAGVVVRAVAGQRELYAPLVSRWTSSTEPAEVARAIRKAWGFRQFYVADLDAILLQKPQFSLYETLLAEGFELLLDAGLRTPAEVAALLESGVSQAVVGLETWDEPESLSGLIHRHGAERVVFSLDLRQGVPLGNLIRWSAREPREIALQVMAAGFSQLIVLDIAQVGVGQGVQTLDLCRALRQQFPQLNLITGGGLRHAEDLATAQAAGVSGLLVASALHDGRLTPPATSSTGD